MHCNYLEKNLVDAQFVLNERKKCFPLGGINRKDFHEAYPEIYKEQLMIAIAIRLIEGGAINFLIYHYPLIATLITKIFEDNHLFTPVEDMFKVHRKDVMLDLLKTQLKGWFCDEMSNWMLNHIKIISPQIIVQVGDLECHNFLLIGDSSNLNQTVVCDVWSEEIYPFIEFEFKQKNNPDVSTVRYEDDEIVPNNASHYLSGKLELISPEKTCKMKKPSSEKKKKELPFEKTNQSLKFFDSKPFSLDIIDTNYGNTDTIDMDPS